MSWLIGVAVLGFDLERGRRLSHALPPPPLSPPTPPYIATMEAWAATPTTPPYAGEEDAERLAEGELRERNDRLVETMQRDVRFATAVLPNLTMSQYRV